jgi:signal-transduction protein with cAMP-binding, CBS, and nucleotidyltransferase domain
MEDVFFEFKSIYFPSLFENEPIDEAGLPKFIAPKEFVSYFLCNLYSRVYDPYQVIVRKGDKFSELYLVEKGEVVVSLKQKWRNEYFIMPENTYFGDYQMILNYKSSERYQANHFQTNTMCIKKKVFLDLINNYPSVKEYYNLRAQLKRIEFKRVRIQLD